MSEMLFSVNVCQISINIFYYLLYVWMQTIRTKIQKCTIIFFIQISFAFECWYSNKLTVNLKKKLSTRIIKFQVSVNPEFMVLPQNFLFGVWNY